jgi:hypothetical protein
LNGSAQAATDGGVQPLANENNAGYAGALRRDGVGRGGGALAQVNVTGGNAGYAGALRRDGVGRGGGALAQVNVTDGNAGYAGALRRDGVRRGGGAPRD